ncbi:MAG: metallophosphoesterase [Kiritimatiellae bacterium]|nr:metallophosphoesterase [Kiritimatiellia bacterium]
MNSLGKPLLRIAALSDIQGYPYPEDSGMRNLERALDILASLKPDVIVNDGDINDTGNDADAVRHYREHCDARLGAIPHVACLGNHELCFLRDDMKASRTPDAIRRDFNAVFGYAPETRVVRVNVKGYEFVALHLSRAEGHTDEEIAAFGAALEDAVRRDPAKPVFAVTHYHPKDTVNDSRQKAKSGALRRLFDRFPQVVSLSGHTHGSLRDPRSIWQGAFTAIETATLCYGSLGLDPPAANQISCLLPYGHESVGCLFLEVFAESIVVRRFDVRERAEIDPGAPWRIPWPHNPATAPYRFDSRSAAEIAPQFAGDPEPTLWYDYGFIYLMFAAACPVPASEAAVAVLAPAAYAAASLLGYRVELADVETGFATSHFHVSDFYRAPHRRADRIVFRAPPGSLALGHRYRCRIIPVGFFGGEGRPAEWSFSVKPDYPLRADAPNALPE